MEISLLAVFLSLFTSLLFLILLFIVLVANPKSIINRAFAFFLLSGASWGFFKALYNLDITSFQEYLFNSLVLVLGAFPAAICYLFFGLIFLRKPYKLLLFYAVPTYLLFSFLQFTNAITSFADKPFPGGYGPHGREVPGEFFIWSIIWSFSFVVILLVYLILELLRRQTDKVYLQKVRLLFITTLTGSFFVFIEYYNPSYWGYPIDILGLLAMALILSYAILRFELVDVSTRLRNTLANVIFGLLLAAGYSLVVITIQLFLPERWNRLIWWPAIIAAIYITSILQPLRERVLKFIDIAFYRTRYDYRETINKFTSKAGELLDLKDLSYLIIKTIKETFGAEAVYLYTLYKGRYRAQNASRSSSFETNDPIIRFLNSNDRVVSKEEIDESFTSLAKIKSLNPQLIIPLKTGEELVGILFIGQRISGDFYSGEDKNLLSALGHSSAIALRNALLYQEVLEDEKQIERLLEREREVNESKNEFISIISHYLRTPLTTIKGYLDLLLKQKLTSRERGGYLIRAYNEQARLSLLVEDLISISSLEKGQLKLFKRNFALGSLIKKVADDFDGFAMEKGLYLKTEFARNLDTIEADSQKLMQAISNLVDNAIKFTSVGGVTLKISKENHLIQICVEDTGIGIEENELPKLFQKFHRGTNIQTFNYEGSGIGLYITKLIVEAHEGRISVHSQLGKGSIFCIFLPTEF